MMFRKTLRISVDRVGALIGQFGKTKTWIEKTCRVNLMIDSNTGEVIVSSEDLQSNSLCALSIRLSYPSESNFLVIAEPTIPVWPAT